MTQGQRKGWIDRPRVDLALSLAGALAYALYELKGPGGTLEPSAITLATAGGVLLGFALVVLERVDAPGTRRARVVFRANQLTVNRNWSQILLVLAAGVLGGLLAVMFGPAAPVACAGVVGYLAAASGLSALRMAWFFIAQRRLAAIEPTVQEERLRKLVG